MKHSILLIFLYSIGTHAQIINITGPSGSGQFGYSVTVLLNGNYVVTDPFYDDGPVSNVGAVYLYNGITHAVISTLKGSTAEDQVGGAYNGIITLTNGNFLVITPNWDNGTATDAGAVTFVDGTSGLSGVISSSNSLVGISANDKVGIVKVLYNGKYIVCSPKWDNGSAIDAGAITWGNETVGVSGLVSSSNSLVGSSTGDNLGEGGITVLSNGNYVICSPEWDNGIINNAGAVTWSDRSSNITGAINNTNSLVGLTANDRIGEGGITVLNNGNYVVASPNWDNGIATDAGAVTWGNGTTGITGIVNSNNSLIGTTTNNWVGFNGVTVLANGNYVVISSRWDSGTVIDAGAVTWANEATGVTGEVNISNSLVGDQPNDRLGEGKGMPNPVIALANGNYVVNSPYWHAMGAVTWGNGTTGITGNVSSSNSLVYNQFGDAGYIDVIPLVNGNFVICNPNFTNAAIYRAGAITWGNGINGTNGVISNNNSLVGSATDDQLGSGGVIALSNGNIVTLSPNWDNGTAIDAGAATWSNGSLNILGTINANNSLFGKANDKIGYAGGIALANGSYVVNSPLWANGTAIDAGAVTWGNGLTGTTGLVSSHNSLVGSSIGDLVGTKQNGLNSGITPLTNGNYLVASSSWHGEGPVGAGAVTWGSGTTGVTGFVTSNNSLIGSKYDNVGYFEITILNNGNYVVNTPSWNNGTASFAGAVTWGDGNAGISGIVSINNSLIGTTGEDAVGTPGAIPLNNGDYVLHSSSWDNGSTVNAGAVTWGNGTAGVVGSITTCNSFLGKTPSGGPGLNFAYDSNYAYLIIGRPSDNMVTIYYPAKDITLATSMDSVSANITANSAVNLIASEGCRLIATVTPNGSMPLNGSVNAMLWLEDTVPVYNEIPFVARHYEIEPTIDPSLSTGRITLYFTQQEFDDFNAHPASTMNAPVDGNDSTGISNIRIGKYPGKSNNGTGLPATYTGGFSLIDPADNDIVWNNSLLRWEISFDVTGFSGFILQTNIPALPLTLLEFTGRFVNQDALLNWRTADEVNTSSFDIERSNDGRSFTVVGNVAAISQPGVHSYTFTDVNIRALGVPTVYYRLKLIDIDGRITYSNIVTLVTDSKINVVFYPNPVMKEGNLVITVTETEQLEGRILDNTGRTIAQHEWTLLPGINSLKLNTVKLPSGLYYLQLKGKNTNKNIRFLKP